MIKVVGAGISGLVLARRLADLGHKVKLYEANEFVGGMLYDYRICDILVSDTGVHIFHTNDEEVMKYILRFGDFVSFNHIVSADVFGKDFTINFPATKNNRLTEEEIKSLFSYYSLKQWGKMPEKEVLDRCSPRNDNSLYFFRDKFVAIPLDGWSKACNNIVNHKNISLCLNYEFTEKDINKDDKIYYSGRLDRLFGYKFGVMDYRSIYIENTIIGEDNANVMNKSRPDVEYTRVINWKRCNPRVCFGHDLYGYEYSKTTDKRDCMPHYVVSGQEELYNKYLELAKEKNIVPIGRIGMNRYINIDEAIKCAMYQKATFSIMLEPSFVRLGYLMNYTGKRPTKRIYHKILREFAYPYIVE